MEASPLKEVTIHTDGGCQGNPGPGGWAAVLRHGDRVREISGAVAMTTNNRMELTGAIEALKALKQRCAVTLFTDSKYVRSGITEWIHSWKRRNWKTTEKKPVQNADLWMELDRLATSHRIQWKWLKGHAGHRDNERCDELATAAIAEIRRKLGKADLASFRKQFEAGRRASPPQAQMARCPERLHGPAHPANNAETESPVLRDAGQ